MPAYVNEPKKHELYEGMSDATPPHPKQFRRGRKSRRQRYAASLAQDCVGMAGINPLGPSEQDQIHDQGRPNEEVGWRTKLQRANNRFGPRAIARPISNLVSRAVGLPQTTLNRQGDEEPDPVSSAAYHEKHQKEHEEIADSLRAAGHDKMAGIHDKLAKTHASARQYHRDRVGKFASFSYAFGPSEGPGATLPLGFPDAQSAQRFIDAVERKWPDAHVSGHGTKLIFSGSGMSIQQVEALASKFGGHGISVHRRPMSFSTVSLSRKQRYELSLACR
jgi:hypothetical protein